MISRARTESQLRNSCVDKATDGICFGRQETRVLLGTLCLLLILASAPAIKAQNCPHIGNNNGQSISGQVTIDSTGASVSDEALLTAGTRLRLDSIATAFGDCTFRTCSGSPCECVDLAIYNRDVAKINIWANISTATALNGSYVLGYVFGMNENGQAINLNVMDTQADNTTGPIYFTPSYPGTYKFHFQGIISGTPCNIQPNRTEVVTITVFVRSNDDDSNNGPTDCNANVGQPVNVTNGNMYIQQTDYQLPGIAEGLEVTRTYNSKSTRSGLFGYGWSTAYDESLNAYGTTALRLNLPDGRSVFFTRQSQTAPFVPKEPLDFHGEIVHNGDGTYTLNFSDGRVHHFTSAGKLLFLADRNNNQIVLTYDANGKPVTVTDPFGRSLSLTYTSGGYVASISDGLGTIATYTYYFGKLTSVTYADNSKFQFTFNFSINRITVVKDALNNILESHTYDSQRRALTSERHGGIERYTLNYVSATQTDVTDSLGNVTKYFFDRSKGRNVVTSVEGVCGCGGGAQVQTWTYDNQLNVTSKTNPLNRTTTYTYDEDGNRLTETNSLGTTTYTYDSFGQVLTVTDPMGGVTTNTYDPQGNLLSVKDALNNTTNFTYGSSGQLLTVTDPRNNTTTFTYDGNGNLTRRTDALNNETNIAYDARGRITSLTNALNQTTSYEYDLASRLKKIIYPDTNFVLFTYDLAGRRTKIKDPRGYETTFSYDAAYRLTTETNADGKITSYQYDLMSNLTGVTDPLNRTTNYAYDEFHRMTKIIYPEASAGAGRLEENFAYDAVGNLTAKTDQAGRVTTFSYDSANRLMGIIDPAQKTTSYEYNARSQQTAVVDPLNQRYEFLYDALGRVTQNKKGAATMSFVYDAAGNRTQRTDFNGATTSYSYDALNRLTTISYPDATSVSYGFDALSRLISATNQNGTVTVAYDNRDRVSSMTDVFGQVVSYAYDANSNRTQMSLNGALSATYQYDVINRLTQLTDSASLAFTFAYDATNKLTTRTAPNGIAATYQYDGLDRLTRLKYAQGITTVADFQYQLNTVNNITQMTDGAGSHNYAYDVLDRLTSATHPGQSNESYSFDDVGNRTASHQGWSYSYQPFNRLVTANSSTFGYDANGNLVSKTDATGAWSYSWDYENRLRQVSSSGGLAVGYFYDALGRRIQRTSSTGETTRFVYDGPDVVRDLDGNGIPIADYLNGPGIDNKLRQTNFAGVSYFITDHLGSTRALTNSSGSITANLSYDSFGNVTSGSAFTRYAYTGRELDGDTGLMYYRARWYDPQQGRFISEDPIGFLGRDINLYGYVRNNPLSFTDPSGLRRCNPLLGALLGALGGGIAGGTAGAGLGAIGGALLGGSIGTALAPVFGTVIVGGGGAAAGATVGAYVGSATGVGIGIGLGIDYCNGDDDKPKCDEPGKLIPFRPGPRSTPLFPPTLSKPGEICPFKEQQGRLCIYQCKDGKRFIQDADSAGGCRPAAARPSGL